MIVMMDINITVAEMEDLDEIMEMMTTARDTVENPDWFVEDNREYVKRHLGENGITLKACGQNKIMGFLIVDIPGEDEENLGFDLGFSKKERELTVLMESAIVRPEARGMGLQRKLLYEAEKWLEGRIYRYALATVHPENRYSRGNLLAMGYEEAMEKLKYGGLPRIIMRKQLLGKGSENQ